MLLFASKVPTLPVNFAIFLKYCSMEKMLLNRCCKPLQFLVVSPSYIMKCSFP
jgi:hypothetical protein